MRTTPASPLAGGGRFVFRDLIKSRQLAIIFSFARYRYHQPKGKTLTNRALIGLILTVMVLVVGCGKWRSDTTVPGCTSRKTIGLDDMPSGRTPSQVTSETVLVPMNPVECDESIEFTGTEFRCSSLVDSYAISPVDGGNGFSNNPVRVEAFADRLRIAWDAVSGHALIVNGNRLAYLDGVSLDITGKTVPAFTVLPYDAWGAPISSLDVCGWKA